MICSFVSFCFVSLNWGWRVIFKSRPVFGEVVREGKGESNIHQGERKKRGLYVETETIAKVK